MIRYAEFCTGVGGFRLGIEASGISAEPVYTNEIDDNCEKTYKQNFGVGFSGKVDRSKTLAWSRAGFLVLQSCD